MNRFHDNEHPTGDFIPGICCGYYESMKISNGKSPEPPTDFASAILAELDALYGYAMALTRHRGEAEDLVQETCLRALSHSHQFQAGSNLKAWLFTLQRHLWFNQLRGARQSPLFTALEPDEEASIPSGMDDDPQVLYIREAERKRVRAALEKLPPEFREIVVLRDLEDFSYLQIADLIGCPIGTVMSRLARARARLKHLLSEVEIRSLLKIQAEENL